MVRITGFVLLLLVFVAGWLLLEPFGPRAETFVVIAPHTGTLGIGTALEQGGVIRSRWLLAALREVEGGTLKAGEYRFDHPVSMVETYRRLRRGDIFTVTLAIPEGYNLFDVAQAVASAGLAGQGDFLKAASKSTALVKMWSPRAESVEGYLFPDTYRFSRHATPEAILTAMTKRFGQVALRLGLDGRAAGRVVTLASLVEREVNRDAERPVVAGVFENRLRLGMPLQTDPTVAYGSELRGTWTGEIHRSELRSDSPYNTYTHTGLPPGPICNPGLAALQAALHPAVTDLLFFVANADGSTRFARDLREHNANVAAYRGAKEKHVQ